MDTREAARRWIDGWLRGWRALDPRPVVALYADDCFFLSQPFREPQTPAEYVEWAFAEEDRAEPWFGEPLLDGEACEIVSIDALDEGEGIGTQLLEAVVSAAREARCRRVQLLTTNNNLRALAFYQKRGFRLVGLVPGAIDEERKRKPSISEVDSAGLPIRDELHLELPLE